MAALSEGGFYVYVGNLPKTASEDQVRKFFGECRGILAFSFHLEDCNYCPTKIAFIKFANRDDQERAYKFNQKFFQGKRVFVASVDSETNFTPKFSVMVKNLNEYITEEDIYEHFKHIGTIECVQKPAIGYGYISFERCESTQRALIMKNRNLKGVDIDIQPVRRNICILLEKPFGPQFATILEKCEAFGLRYEAESEMETKLLVTNIPRQVPEAEILEYLGKFGKILDWQMQKSAIAVLTNSACVTYADPKTACRVFLDGPHYFQGGCLDVYNPRITYGEAQSTTAVIIRRTNVFLTNDEIYQAMNECGRVNYIHRVDSNRFCTIVKFRFSIAVAQALKVKNIAGENIHVVKYTEQNYLTDSKPVPEMLPKSSIRLQKEDILRRLSEQEERMELSRLQTIPNEAYSNPDTHFYRNEVQIMNYPIGTNLSQFRDYFRKYGNVVNLREFIQGDCIGVAVVSFDTRLEARRACSLNQNFMNGKRLLIHMADEKLLIDSDLCVKVSGFTSAVTDEDIYDRFSEIGNVKFVLRETSGRAVVCMEHRRLLEPALRVILVGKSKVQISRINVPGPGYVQPNMPNQYPPRPAAPGGWMNVPQQGVMPRPNMIPPRAGPNPPPRQFAPRPNLRQIEVLQNRTVQSNGYGLLATPRPMMNQNPPMRHGAPPTGGPMPMYASPNQPPGPGGMFGGMGPMSGPGVRMPPLNMGGPGGPMYGNGNQGPPPRMQMGFPPGPPYNAGPNNNFNQPIPPSPNMGGPGPQGGFPMQQGGAPDLPVVTPSMRRLMQIIESEMKNIQAFSSMPMLQQFYLVHGIINQFMNFPQFVGLSADAKISYLISGANGFNCANSFTLFTYPQQQQLISLIQLDYLKSTSVDPSFPSNPPENQAPPPQQPQENLESLMDNDGGLAPWQVMKKPKASQDEPLDSEPEKISAQDRFEEAERLRNAAEREEKAEEEQDVQETLSVSSGSDDIPPAPAPPTIDLARSRSRSRSQSSRRRRPSPARSLRSPRRTRTPPRSSRHSHHSSSTSRSRRSRSPARIRRRTRSPRSRSRHERLSPISRALISRPISRTRRRSLSKSPRRYTRDRSPLRRNYRKDSPPRRLRRSRTRSPRPPRSVRRESPPVRRSSPIVRSRSRSISQSSSPMWDEEVVLDEMSLDDFSHGRSGSVSLSPEPASSLFDEEISAGNNHNAEPAGTTNDRTLFVNNLPYGITDTELLDLFGRFGQVVSHRIIMHPQNFVTVRAYITFDTLDQAVRALDMHLKRFRKCLLRVAFVNKRQKWRAGFAVNVTVGKEYDELPIYETFKMCGEITCLWTRLYNLKQYCVIDFKHRDAVPIALDIRQLHNGWKCKVSAII